MVTFLILSGGNSLLLSQEHQKKSDEKGKVTTQENTGDLAGVVTDEENAPLPGVTVKAISPALMGTAATVTDEMGRFRLLNLPPGTYTVTFTLPGFRTLRKEGIIVRLDRTLDLRGTMKLSILEEDITLIDVSPVIDPRKLEETRPIPKDVQEVVTELSKTDGVIMGNVANLAISIEKLQDIVNQLTGEINEYRQSIENLQKECGNLGKRLKKIEEKIK
jgi:hypothetical protein